MNHHLNLVRIKSVSRLLGKYADQSAFVGGATVSLYADRPVREVRPTDDVDVIVELMSYAKEAELDTELRKTGFVNDIESGIRNRYLYQGLIVDVVPVHSEVAGFSNRWYPEGYANAQEYLIDELDKVKIFTAPYFIATKLEAFRSRGKDNGITSRDFEDIVFVMENRTTLWKELENTHGELRKYLRQQFSNLLANKNFAEWVSCHVEPLGSPPADFFILPRLKEFVTSSD